MNKVILRNIAIISAIFIVTFSIMLITNYFQVRGTTPLQTEVVETLKKLNDENNGNLALQEQIRQLDLLARKAYFVRIDHLVVGVYILLGMLIVFIVSARLYFVRDKNIPLKAIDQMDEWIIKTRARKYVGWIASGIAAVALIFVVLTSPYLTTKGTTPKTEEAVTAAKLPETENNPEQAMPSDSLAIVSAEADSSKLPVDSASKQSPVSKITHNAFRGNNSNGISSAKGVPVQWNLGSGAHIAWKHNIPRAGFNSPIINGNKVFFSGADDKARELYCYDLTTGKQLWTLAAVNIPGSPSKMPETTVDTGLAASSVATNGKQVCAIFATGDIICADMEGKKLWAKNLGKPDNHYGYASSLLTFGNLLIVQYDNQNSPKVVALDITTGTERWSKSRKEKVTWSSPIITYVNKTPQLVLMGNPAITAYNPNNGEQLWRVECLSGEVGSSACSSNGIVFGASEYAKLIAINAADGSVLWEANDYLPEVSSPVATKDYVYLATSYGTVASYDIKTGKLGKVHELNGTQFYSSPIIAEGKIFLFSNDGKMHVFSADAEFRLLQSFETGEKTFATPAFTDNKIVVRTEKSIYCVTAN